MGSFSGSFASKPGEVAVPEGVTYPSWDEDPGGFLGDNTLEITVTGSGVVSGKLTGALGTLIASGLVDEDGFSIGLSPQNLDDPTGMTGVITGTLEGSKMTGSLRVASSDASIVRQAELSLSKQ